MPSLFVNGNIHEQTFANAILAANERARLKTGRVLSRIFVLHSPQSEAVLATSSTWRVHLQRHGVDAERAQQFTVDLAKGSQSLELVADHLRLCIRGLEADDEGDGSVFVDLTNGNSQYKNVLSVAAFVLGIREQYVLDLSRVRLDGRSLPEASERRDPRQLFLSPEELQDAYVPLPDPLLLDQLALAWRTEVRRYGRLADDLQDGVAQLEGKLAIGPSPHLASLLLDAVDHWLLKTGDSSALLEAVRESGQVFEALVNHILSRAPAASRRMQSLKAKIDLLLGGWVGDLAERDRRFFLRLAHTLREYYNEAKHEPPLGLISENVRARLAVEMLLAVSGVLLQARSFPRLPEATAAAENEGECFQVADALPQSEERYYFGVDGDDTGKVLEGLFASNGSEAQFKEFSHRVRRAMKQVADRAEAPPLSGKVVFLSGDDLLFRGSHDAEALRQIQQLYQAATRGYTCSVGFGRTPREAYVALKMAKARPGKNSIVGLEEVRRSVSA
jgi:hypothetical protein